MNAYIKRIGRYYTLIRVWLGSYGYHLLFVFTLLLLSALVGWWTIFLKSSIENDHKNSLFTIVAKSKILSLELGGKKDRNLSPEMGLSENRLELVKCSAVKNGISFPLKPNRPDLCIRPRAKTIEEIELPRVGQIERAYQIIETKSQKYKALKFMDTIQNWLIKAFYNHYKQNE